MTSSKEADRLVKELSQMDEKEQKVFLKSLIGEAFDFLRRQVKGSGD